MHSYKSNQSLCGCMPGKEGSSLQMRSCNTERYAFGREEFKICEREKRVGEGGRCGWGKILFRRFACQRGAKIGT